MPNLIIERGREKGLSIPLEPGASVVVGRDPSAQVAISDPAASRRHFEVRSKDGLWTVRDLGSKNHTFVNDDIVQAEQTLTSGDQIQVGETVFSFEEEEAAIPGGKPSSSGLAGKELAGYKILERLGRGGMGTVYKARQISLNRVVALKILSAKFSKDPEFVSRFVSEARSAGQLNHPNVVQVFDVTAASGLHMFSMELMEGGSVQDLLASLPNSRMPWTEALPMITEATRGLVFAEKRGIIHRDIKPDNLMLTSEQKVKIADLGLAKKADDDGDGKIFGTPHFISPEQAQGKEVTHAADIYSLGATFYRMVAGKTMFQADTVKDIVRRQISDAPEPIGAIVPEFPSDLTAILDKMIAKRVDRRYMTATSLLADLEAFELAHQIELAGGVRKSNKPLLIGLAVLVLAVGAAAVHFALKPPKTIILPGENGNGPVVPPPPPPDTGPTPEQIQKEIEDNCRSAYKDILIKDARMGDVTLETKTEWLRLADEYEALKEQFPKSKVEIQPALDRAREIRETIGALERVYEETVKKAETYRDTTQGEIDAHITAEEWSQAMDRARIERADSDARKHMEFLPEFETYLLGVEAACVAACGVSQEKVLADASAMMVEGRPGESFNLVKDWADRTEVNAGGHEQVLRFVAGARDWVQEREEAHVAMLRDILKADRAEFVVACRAVRSAGAGAENSPVFDLRFDTAAARLRSSAGRLKTWLYQDRLETHAKRMDTIHSAWAAFRAQLTAGEIFGGDEPIPNLPRVSDRNRAFLVSDQPVDEDGFAVRVVLGAGEAKQTFTWTRLRPGNVWDSLIRPHVDRVAPETCLGLAWMFAELAHPTAASACLERAIAAGIEFSKEEEAALRAEIGALEEFYAFAAMEKNDPENPENVLAAVRRWRNTRFSTDAFVLLDGRAPAATPQLFEPSRIDEFLRTYGVRPK